MCLKLGSFVAIATPFPYPLASGGLAILPETSYPAAFSIGIDADYEPPWFL